jgi:hypothetical protein
VANKKKKKKKSSTKPRRRRAIGPHSPGVRHYRNPRRLGTKWVSADKVRINPTTRILEVYKAPPKPRKRKASKRKK